MTDTDLQKCVEWIRAHAKHWQTYKRAQWEYKWKGRTLVRYLDNVSMRELQDGLLLEYLCSPACMETLSLYSQDVPREWTPVSAWYESMPMRPSNSGIAQVRLYHALKVDVDSGGDGPYTVENGCMYKVSWQFFWKQTEVGELPESSSGVNYQIRNLTRDDEDGTFSYVLERRERVQQDIPEYLMETDDFADHFHEEHHGVKGDTSEGGKAASCDDNGTKVTRTVRKNEDCTHDVINDRTVDKSYPGAVTETRSTIRGTTQTTVNRGMPDKAPETGLGIGDTVRNERTDSGLWTQTITRKLAGFAGWIRRVCSKTVFRHEHSETSVSQNDPGFTHSTDVGEHIGTVVETHVTRNDDNTFDVNTTTRTDNPVENAEVSVHKTLTGVVKTVTHRNQPAPLPTENLAIGARVVNRETDSGLFDVTSEVSAPEDVGKVGEDCTRTAHEHRHTTTNVVSDDPGPVDVSRDDGTILERSVQKTDIGAFRVTDMRRVAIPVQSTTTGGASHRTVTTTSLQNQEDQNLGAQSPEQNVEVDVSSSKNEFGLYNGTVRIVNHVPITSSVKYGSPLTHETTKIDDNATEKAEEHENPEQGTIYSVSCTPNELGGYRNSVTTRKAMRKKLPSDGSDDGTFQEVKWNDNVRGRTTITTYENRIVIFRNFQQAPSVSTKDGETASVSIGINEFGLLDGTYHYRKFVGETAIEGGGGGAGEQWDKHKNIRKTRKETFVVRGRDGKMYRYITSYTRDFHVRYLYSSKVNMFAEIIAGENYPEYGMTSGFMNGFARIVTANGNETKGGTVREAVE